MANDHEPVIEQLWRQQPQGRDDVTLDAIRTKAREFDARVQRWNLVGGVTLGLLVVKNAWEVVVDTDVVERAGDLLLLFALLYVVHRFISHARRKTQPAALGQTNCVEHYRTQLMYQQEISRDGWKYVLPFAPGLGLMVFARALQGRSASQVTAMIVIALALFVGVVWSMARSRRKLEREIAALDGE